MHVKAYNLFVAPCPIDLVELEIIPITKLVAERLETATTITMPQAIAATTGLGQEAPMLVEVVRVVGVILVAAAVAAATMQVQTQTLAMLLLAVL